MEFGKGFLIEKWVKKSNYSLDPINSRLRNGSFKWQKKQKGFK
jgi:hypothetical protein